MSPTSTSDRGTPEPRRNGWRGLPWGGLVADVAIYLAATFALAGLTIGALFALPAAPGPQFVTMTIESASCPARGFDEAAVLALLRERGELRALRGDQGEALPYFLPVRMLPRPRPGQDTTDPAEGREVVVGTMHLHPRDTQPVTLGARALERAGGCRITDFLMAPLPREGEARVGLEQRLGARLGIVALVSSLGSALVLWLLRGRRQAPRTPVVSTARAVGIGMLGGVALQSLAWLAKIALAGTGLELAPSNITPLSAMLEATPWLAIGFIVLLAPFAEELAYRHVMLRRFANAGHPTAGLLIVSGLFAMAHEFGPGAQPLLAWLATTVLYAGIGMGLGAIYLRTGRLAASVAAHVVMNAIGLAMLAYSTS